MHKLFLVLCTLACCLCFSSESYSSEGSSGHDILSVLIPDDADLNSVEDHQTVAKFFGIYMFQEGQTCVEEANIFSYQKDDNSGTIFQISWYADGYITTQLNGSMEGHQTVVWKGEVIGISYPRERNGRSCINKYPWGVVWTSSHEQCIYWENSENQ